MSDTSAVGMSALTGSFLGLSVIIVGLRFFARSRAQIPYLIDDWLMLLALASFIGTSTCVFLLVHIKAIGYSSFQFTAAEKIARYDESTRIQTALVATTVACLACTKASALFFYRRMFCYRTNGQRVFNGVLIASIVIIGCWFITFEFLTIFQCKGHYTGLWDPKKYAKYCTITWSFLYGFSVSDVILDVLILALPIPSILRLHTTITKKISVLAIFMVACVALAASITRLVIYVRIYILGVEKFDKLDSEHILTQYVFYYVLECGCSVVAINIPSVWPIFSGRALNSILKMAQSVASLTSRSTDRSTSNDTSIYRGKTHSVDVSYQGNRSSQGDDTQDFSEKPRSSRFEILREDSVHLSSEVRVPEDIHLLGNRW